MYIRFTDRIYRISKAKFQIEHPGKIYIYGMNGRKDAAKETNKKQPEKQNKQTPPKKNKNKNKR